MKLISRNLNTHIYPYAVEPDGDIYKSEWDEVIHWCRNNFGDKKWFREFYCVRFHNEEHLNWFLLRWSS